MKGQAILKVSPELLVEMLKGFETGFNGKYEVVQDGLPKDVKLVDVCIEDMSRHPSHYMPGIFLKLESDSYPAPEPGHLLTVLNCPVFSAVRKKES